ncbi:MAG: ABC transporter ATP-binding protein [Anaerolineae bacterium]|nr:ABC transporter ATP-binding protein [Anaerolineae bacterium]
MRRDFFVNPVITTRHLTRRFGEKIAVDGLTLDVYPGEIFGMLGHNGAGKTTTVRLLNGVFEPSSGEAQVLGLNPAQQGPQLRRRTGVLTETPSLDERLTGVENLAFYADFYGVPKHEVKKRIEDLLTRFELADRQREKVGGYSKGMKQRLALCRALVHQPEMLFLDEPTSGLDPVSARQVWDLIRHMSREEGRTVLICTHNLTEAQHLCHWVAILEHGRLLAVGTPHDIAAQIGLKTRFRIEVAREQAASAMEILGQVPGIRASQEDGAVEVDGAERERIPDLLAALFRAEVRFYSVIPQEASLEDIYFALHEGRVQ